MNRITMNVIAFESRPLALIVYFGVIFLQDPFYLPKGKKQVIYIILIPSLDTQRNS